MTLKSRFLLACVGMAFLVTSTLAQVPFAFTPVQLDLQDVDFGRMAYADVDGDGTMDILTLGNTAALIPHVSVGYVAIGGDIVPISQANDNPKQEFVRVNLPGGGFWSGDARWLDFNLDGYLDVIISGTTHTAAPFEIRPFEGNLRMFRGTSSGTYEEVNTQLPGVYAGSVVPGDYDNDGDEDLLVSGLLNPSTPFSRLYSNSNGNFIRQNTRITALALGTSEWVDYDGDGDLDLFHSGIGASNDVHTLLYNNDGTGRLTAQDHPFPDVFFGSTAWGDYDADGDLDVAITGATLDYVNLLRPTSAVFRNNGGGNFVVEQKALIPDLFNGALDWADYDNDGDIDLMISGATDMSSGRLARIFRQENGYLIDRIWLPAVSGGSGIWGDFDGNDVVDLLLTGSNRSGQPLSRLYRNEIRASNTRPNPPSGLNAQVSSGSVVLSWDPADDVQTATEALMYNLRIGTQSGMGNVMPAYADPSTGVRRMPGPGNVWQVRRRTVRLSPGTYFWSVQSVDQAYAGSEFAEEQSFTISSAPGLATASEEAQRLETEMGSVFPNPFREVATVTYSLRESGRVDVAVYNALGQRVRVLVTEYRAAGSHRVTWEGTDENGARLAAGVYFVRMNAGGHEHFQRLVLVR